MEDMEPMNAVLLIIFVIGLALLVLRMRRRPRTLRHEQEESMFVTAPARSVEKVENRQKVGAAPRHALFTDRLFAGTAAALLLGGIVAVLEITGLAGRSGTILAMPVAAFPIVENLLGPLFSGVAIVVLLAFVIGFAWPRLVSRPA
jgi:hypothetical protein